MEAHQGASRPVTVVETERLLLRPLSVLDAEAMQRVFGDPEVMRFGPGVRTPAWVEGWLCDCLESYATRGFGLLALVEKRSGEVIGYCGLSHCPDVAGRPEIEIGYRLARPFWGRGYATEGVRAIRDHAFGVLDLPRVIALIDPQNTASIRVAEKAGLRLEGEAMLEGYDHPDHVFAMANPRGAGG